jgi:aerobic carbon-monoxide dehydrogenase small subunit
MKSAITLKINGEDFELSVEPKRTLLDALRDDLGMTGTKKGCDQGDCGACTVLLDGKAVNSCLILAVEAVGHEITTIEGLAKEGVLHPLQEAFIKLGAMQCGYCTPGMLLSGKALLDSNPHPTREDVKVAIEGNLCRCTGYVKIIDAIIEASRTI